MKSGKYFSLLQISVFCLLLGISGVLGYLYYDLYKTNIQNRELIAETKIENLDLYQDLEIMKGKYEKLEKEIINLKDNVAKISYKKTYKPKKIYSAGKSSKKKHYFKKSKIDYKKLYYELKSKCSKRKSKRS